MKRIIFVAAITLFALVFVGVLAKGQESSPTATFTVRGAEVLSGEIVVSGQMTSTSGRRTSVELHCNKGQAQCFELAAGTYVMVQLPKNRGTYECTNVELYLEGTDPESSGGGKVGAYCLIQR